MAEFFLYPKMQRVEAMHRWHCVWSRRGHIGGIRLQHDRLRRQRALKRDRTTNAQVQPQIDAATCLLGAAVEGVRNTLSAPILATHRTQALCDGVHRIAFKYIQP